MKNDSENENETRRKQRIQNILLILLPILIAANPASDVETSFLKIRDLRELIR